MNLVYVYVLEATVTPNARFIVLLCHNRFIFEMEDNLLNRLVSVKWFHFLKPMSSEWTVCVNVWMWLCL